MKKITAQNIQLFNTNLRYESPEEIVKFALEISEKPIVTTSFGAHSAAILHLCTNQFSEIPVIWCDTGYNTEATYRHVQQLQKSLNLALDIFSPRYTTAFLDNTLGRPGLDDPQHEKFSEKVKLEPFQRAFEKYQPDVWFTNLRKEQSTHREHLDILSFGASGALKVSPFFYWTTKELVEYISKHQLPTEYDYFDPVKAQEHRECGIHLKN